MASNSKRSNGRAHITDPRDVLGPAKTRFYEPPDHRWWTRPRDLPPFTFLTIQAMLLDPTIRLGLAMREAPLHATEFAYKDGEAWTPGIAARRPEVAAFVESQLRRIWAQLNALTSNQVWGWAAAEVCYRIVNKRIEFNKFLPLHSQDVRCIKRGGDVIGVRVSRIKDNAAAPNSGHVDLFFPKCVWTSFCPEAGADYGTSVLLGPYSPWADKWLDGGALDVRRLFMHKDAYGGADMGYPPGTTDVDGKGEIPNRDIAREIVEQMQAGSVTARPSTVDPTTGKELWPLTRATVASNPQHILQYPKDLDVEMLRGMEISDDVLTAEQSGSWAGKLVPMQAFYTGLERWRTPLVNDCIVPQVLEYLVKVNFGDEPFEVSCKPMAEQALDQQGGGRQGGDLGGGMMPPGMGQPPGMPPQMMSLEEQVGRGILDAAKVVRAAKAITKPQRMARQPGQRLIRSFERARDAHQRTRAVARGEAASDWSRIQSRSRLPAWKNARTGQVRYQEERPGETHTPAGQPVGNAVGQSPAQYDTRIARPADSHLPNPVGRVVGGDNLYGPGHQRPPSEFKQRYMSIAPPLDQAQFGDCGPTAFNVAGKLHQAGIRNFKVVDGIVHVGDKNATVPHTWLELPSGEVYDPTVSQFGGAAVNYRPHGEYREVYGSAEYMQHMVDDYGADALAAHRSARSSRQPATASPATAPPTPARVSSSARTSRASVEADTEAVREWKRHMNGLDIAAAASLVGAPDDARVTVRPDGPGRFNIQVHHKDIESCGRTLHVDSRGQKSFHNDIFVLKPEAKGKGLGSQIFYDQVMNASAAGFTHIETHAAGMYVADSSQIGAMLNYDASREAKQRWPSAKTIGDLRAIPEANSFVQQHTNRMNGYYTWPALGYDQDLETVMETRPEETQNDLKRRFPQAKTVLDLMGSQAGKDWWLKHGSDLHSAEFDLTPGSRNMVFLATKMANKAGRAAGVSAQEATAAHAAPPAASEPGMTDDSMRRRNARVDRIRRRGLDARAATQGRRDAATAAEAAPAPAENTPERRRVQRMWGHAAGAIVRWMGSQGWTNAEATRVLTHLGLTVSPHTIREALPAGRSGSRGTVPTLASEHASKLTNLRSQRLALGGEGQNDIDLNDEELSAFDEADQMLEVLWRENAMIQADREAGLEPEYLDEDEPADADDLAAPATDGDPTAG